jgi:hypothetical protein
MIKTLRKKFIFFAMASVTVLLVTLLLSIYGFTWILFDRQENKVLEMLVNSNGVLLKPNPKDLPQYHLPPELDIMRSIHFFTVTADRDGQIISCDLNQIRFVTDAEAREIAKKVLEKSSSSGRIDCYKYRVKKTDENQIIYFLDLTREQLTLRTVVLTSSILAVISWAAAFVFSFFFSANFVHPIMAGLEKQKQFITNAGHEIKTPLAVIQSNNDAMMLIHGENKYNRNIKAQVNRLGELTSNLLMQARLDEEAELVKEHINISELAAEVIQPFKDSAEIQGFSFKSTITPDIIFSTNRQGFTQLLTVLMDNAVKYTTEKGNIFFSLSQESKSVIIMEENSCDPEMNVTQEYLFERFYRADSARTHNEQRSGYGIGLSVARSICESLGGELSASYPKKGIIRFTAKF